MVYSAHEKMSHTARKTVANTKIPRRVESESSPRDPPAIQAIATENETARSIVTTDTQPRVRIVSRYAMTAGSVGTGHPEHGTGIKSAAWNDSVPAKMRTPRNNPITRTKLFGEMPPLRRGGSIIIG